MWFKNVTQATNPQVRWGDGTAALPDAGFTNETTTGLFRPGSGIFGFTVLGTEVMRLTPTGETLNKGLSLTLSGATSGTVSLKAADATTSYSVKLPSVQGGAGSVLSNDGSGNLSWVLVLPIANGGTNSSTALNNNRMMISSGGKIVETAAVASSKILKTDANGLPIASTASVAAVEALSGTNTGDQTITLTGDVTGSGTGSFAATIGNNTVTNTKQAQVPAFNVKGNNTNATANVTDLSPSQWAAMMPEKRLQSFTSGSGTMNLEYAFFVASNNVTVGATYTHNSITYTVTKTVASGNIIYLTGSAAPLSSGTLTKASGTGDASIAFSSFAKPLRLVIEAVAGGGGGSFGGTSGGTGGSSGGNTTFGSIITCVGGTLGNWNSNGNGGGSGTVSAPAVGFGISGGPSQGSFNTNDTNNMSGGMGGGTGLGPGGSGGYVFNAGLNAPANSGGGGGGGGAGLTPGSISGAGGSGGGYAWAQVTGADIAATYSYAVGSAGSGSTAGSAGGNGGNGGAGAIYVWQEYY